MNNLDELDSTENTRHAMVVASRGGYYLPNMLSAYKGQFLFGIPWYAYSVLDRKFWAGLVRGGKLAEKIYPGWSNFDEKTKELAILDEAQRQNERLVKHLHFADDPSIEKFFENLFKKHD